MKYRFHYLMLALLAALVLGGCGAGGDSQPLSEVDRTDTEPITLRLNAEKGERHRYRLTTEMEALTAQGRVDYETHWEQTVTEVKPEAITWNIRFELKNLEVTGVFSGAEQSFRQFDGAEVPVQFDRLGRSTDEEGASGATANLSFPEHPVRPGDEWAGEIDLNNETVPVTYRFIKRTTHKDRPAIHIEGWVSDSRVKSLTPIRFLIEPATGALLEATAEYEIIKPERLRMRYEIQRL